MIPDNDFWSWVDDHSGEDPTKLRFAAGRWPFEWIHEAIGQIDRRRRAAKKLPTLAANDRFLFPSDLSVEQSTSEALADYHSSLLPEGSTVIDLTAGLGVDAIALSRRAMSVIAIDRDPAVADALRYNAEILGINNMEVICADCRDFLNESTGLVDVIFIDPARRDDAGGRVYALSDCAPDVTAMLPLLRSRCSTLIVKASPMLDITATCRELPGTTRVIALGTRVECKELDIIVADDDDPTDSPIAIEAVTLLPDHELSRFTFTREEEAGATARCSMPKSGDRLLLPYPAVMKAAPFKLLCQRFGIKTVGGGTHLFFTDADAGLSDTFPGDEYRVIEVLPYASSVIKRLAKRYPQALVAVRNMGITADELRRKLRVRDGGDTRIIGFGAPDGSRHLLIARPTD